MADSLYQGEAGVRYEQHRAKSKSDYAQQMSARVFLPLISDASTIVDFGCGTGGILGRLPCIRRIGVEINPASAAEARTRGVEVFSSVTSVPSACADLAISHHALEHVQNPREVLLELRRVLRLSGRLAIVVPCELPRRSYFRQWSEALDVHLYSWNPRSIGNLVRDCGYVVEQTSVLRAGYSHYTAWADSIPLVSDACSFLVSRGLGRFNTFCVAHNGEG
jgi:SAM-dependent methyltransferase